MFPGATRGWAQICAIGMVALLSYGLRGAVPIKVAFVGDSITEGSGLANPSTESYPAKTQRLLGPEYQVRNFGVSGRTLLKKGDFPYWKEAAYAQSRNYAPDVVVIKLGTNDSKPQNWKFGTNFTTDFEDLVASYLALAVPPRIILATPCPVFKTGAYDIKPAVVRLEIAPAVRELAERMNLELIDFNTRLDTHGEWFPDTVHPNSRGTTVMSAIAWAAITRAPAEPTTPGLGVTPLIGNRVALAWPTDAARMVLQSATMLKGAETPWLVVEQIAVNESPRVLVTNSTSAGTRFYRLWQP